VQEDSTLKCDWIMAELKVSRAKMLVSRPAIQGHSEHHEVTLLDQPIACAHTVVSAKSAKEEEDEVVEDKDEEDKLEGKEAEQARNTNTTKPMMAAML